MKATVNEEYAVRIKSKERGKYIFSGCPFSGTLEGCMKLFSHYREEWECCMNGLDFNDIKIVHRTVITTEWDVV